MEGSKRVMELSFQRPYHEVDLFHRAISAGSAASVLCVANGDSKLFIATKLIEEIWRRDEKARKIAFLVADGKSPIVKPFLEAAAYQSILSVKTFFDGIQAPNGDHVSFLDSEVMVTDGNGFVEMLDSGKLDLPSFSLIVVDDCHHITDKENPLGSILKQVESFDSVTRPKIVGLSSDLLDHQTCSQELERFVTSLEQAFSCTADVSSDLLAVNKYGEQATEEIVYYKYDQTNDPLHQKCLEILQDTLCFLRDYQTTQSTLPCIMFVKHVVSECYRVLLMFGLLCTRIIAQIIIKEITKMEKKCLDCDNKLILQFCKTQMNLVLNVSKLTLSENCKESFTDLTTKLLVILSKDFKLHCSTQDKVNCKVNCKNSSGQNPLDESSSSVIQPPVNADVLLSVVDTKQECSDLKSYVTSPERDTHEVCNANLKSQGSRGSNKNMSTNNQTYDPLCVIVVPSTIVAKALNSLINRLSNSMPEYSNLKSGFIHGDSKGKNRTVEQELTMESGDNVMQCVQDGSINVLVATFEVEQEIFVPRCSLLIRLGMPKLYESYLNVKRKLRMAGAKFVVCSREDDKAKAEELHKAFQRIESILQMRCPNCRPPCQQVAELFTGEPLVVYKPFGDEGPKVDLLSSISLVNRYCSKYPSSGAGSPTVVCRTEEKWNNDDVEFLSTLYLPRNSPIYYPIKGSVSLKRCDVNEVTVLKARVKSEMYAALETCRQLHQAGELDEDLEPIMRYTVFPLTAETEPCDSEVADSCQGMAGSLKRNRAYKRKFPSVLEHNLPRAGEPCHLYCINMTLSKPWTFERAVRSQCSAKPSASTHSLGIFSRKPLPKLPGMVIFDRAGEVTVTVSECNPRPVVLTTDQMSLIQRFTDYIFREIARPKNDSLASSLVFDPATADFGYFSVILNDMLPTNAKQPGKEIAFDFLTSLEHALGSFETPTDPPPPGVHNMELFRDSVVTAIYNDKMRRYYVADIRYDCSPADPFPNPLVASTFSEYYQLRYGVEVTLDQPLLDVDHTHARLNCLIPRYQNIKGKDLSLPGKASKRTQKSQVFVIPELCSIHPVPGYLWRQIANLPAVLYRVESVLLAEELRSSLAKELGMGAVDWPSEVPLPLLTLGEMVGEEIACQEELCNNGSTECNAQQPSIGPRGRLLEDFDGLTLEVKKQQDDVIPTRSILNQDSSSLSPSSRTVETALDPNRETLVGNILKEHESRSELNRGSRFVKETEPRICSTHSTCREVLVQPGCGRSPLLHLCEKPSDLESNVASVTIWNDPHLSSLYKTCGPSSTLILRALTCGGAGDVFSLERLEMYGDSFVKYAISSSLFYRHLHDNEGKLSFIRGLAVSNRQLFYLARQQGLPSYVLTRSFLPFVNWMPSGFYLNDCGEADGLSDNQLVLTPVEGLQEMDEEEEEDGPISSALSMGASPEGPSGEGHSSDVHLNPYLHHVCPDKTIADVSEALIGAYLLSFGPKGAYRLMEWLGMEVTTPRIIEKDFTKFESHPAGDLSVKADDSHLSLHPGPSHAPLLDSRVICHTSTRPDHNLMQTEVKHDVVQCDSKVPEPARATCHISTRPIHNPIHTEVKHDVVLCDSKVPEPSRATCHMSTRPDHNPMQTGVKHDAVQSDSDSESLPTYKLDQFGEFKQLEDSLQYHFSNKSLLLQAFTHTSLPRDLNTVPNSYEQLEFLGDALLDFLVTQHLFLCHRHLSPGELTDLRSALVNNYSFAALAVNFGFAKLLRSLSPPMFHTVNKFVTKLEERRLKERPVNPDQVYASVFVVPSEDDEEAVDVEVPKPLGDLFEAVAGAIYVDCGQDLDRVWQVYLPILKPSIDYYSKNLPLSPVRRLLEMMPNAAKFSPVESLFDGRFKCTLTVSGCGKFVGTGRNFRIAKSTAAQRALSVLQQKGQQQ